MKKREFRALVDNWLSKGHLHLFFIHLYFFKLDYQRIPPDCYFETILGLENLF